MRYLRILQPMKNNVRSEYAPWKNIWFCSFPFFGFNLVMKLRNFDFESHGDTLIFFWSKRYVVRFEYIPWKNIWLCFISIVCVQISPDSSFAFKCQCFLIKNDVRFGYSLSKSVWFGLSFAVWVKFCQWVEIYKRLILLK